MRSTSRARKRLSVPIKSERYGLNGVPTRMWWPRAPSETCFGNRVFADDDVKMRALGRALIQDDCRPYEKWKPGHRGTRGDAVGRRRQRRELCLKPRRPDELQHTPRSWGQTQLPLTVPEGTSLPPSLPPTSSLQASRPRTSGVVSPAACGTVLWRPRERTTEGTTECTQAGEQSPHLKERHRSWGRGCGVGSQSLTWPPPPSSSARFQP